MEGVRRELNARVGLWVHTVGGVLCFGAKFVRDVSGRECEELFLK